ncbi:MAG: hypothetical protein H6558_06475 [Lewinellaceae bacterium]|nr:hypothetical protein [Lewinellaceae bacterium]
MDPMDQFFKDKLTERQYEYHDAYWEEAESMITRRERRRRAAWWWWIAIALLLIGVGAGGWWYWQGRQKDPRQTETVRLGGPAGEENPAEAIAGQSTPGQDQKPAAPERLSNSAEGRRNGQSEEALGKETDNPPVSPVETQGRREKALSADGPEEKKEISETEKPSAGQKHSIVSPGPSLIDSAKIKQSPPVAFRNGPEPGVEEVSRLLGPIDGRPMVERLAISANSALIRPGRRLSWQLALGVMANPSDGKRILGALAGIRTSYRLKDNMVLTVGGQYRLRGGSFGASQESRQVAYRFGREEERYSLQPNRLHYAEFLLQAEWPLGRHCLTLGAGWSYLLGIEGSLSSAVKEEFALSFAPATTQEKGWLDKKGYKKQFLAGRAGYNYQLLPRLKIGVEAQYVPGGILDGGPGMETEFPMLEEASPLIIDLGIKYRL